MSPLLDTNIVIDILRGWPAAFEEFRRYSDHSISVITWIEVMVGVEGDEADLIRQRLRSLTLLQIDGQTAEIAVSLRRAHRIKLPDALVWATARRHGLLLLTRNTKDFPAEDPSVRFPYTLS